MTETFLALLAPLLTPLSPAVVVIVFGTMIIAGFMRGFVGFGSALIIVMIYSVIFGPIVAVAISCLTGLPSVAQLIPTAIRHSERDFVVPFACTAFIAVPFGTWVLVSSDPVIMKIAISVFVLASVALMYRGWHATAKIGPAVLVGFGLGAGLVQGSAGVGGPPAVVLALSRPGEPMRQRANVIGATSALALAAPLPLWYYGLLRPEVIALSLILFPLYSLTTWAGARFFSRNGQRHFRLSALLMLAVMGGITLGLAVQDYWARG